MANCRKCGERLYEFAGGYFGDTMGRWGAGFCPDGSKHYPRRYDLAQMRLEKVAEEYNRIAKELEEAEREYAEALKEEDDS